MATRPAWASNKTHQIKGIGREEGGGGWRAWLAGAPRARRGRPKGGGVISPRQPVSPDEAADVRAPSAALGEMLRFFGLVVFVDIV